MRFALLYITIISSRNCSSFKSGEENTVGPPCVMLHMTAVKMAAQLASLVVCIFNSAASEKHLLLHRVLSGETIA